MTRKTEAGPGTGTSAGGEAARCCCTGWAWARWWGPPLRRRSGSWSWRTVRAVLDLEDHEKYSFLFQDLIWYNKLFKYYLSFYVCNHITTNEKLNNQLWYFTYMLYKMSSSINYESLRSSPVCPLNVSNMGLKCFLRWFKLCWPSSGWVLPLFLFMQPSSDSNLKQG